MHLTCEAELCLDSATSEAASVRVVVASEAVDVIVEAASEMSEMSEMIIV